MTKPKFGVLDSLVKVCQRLVGAGDADTVNYPPAELLITASVPDGWRLVPHAPTSEMRTLMLRADEFTVDEMWIMLLALAPKPEDVK